LTNDSENWNLPTKSWELEVKEFKAKKEKKREKKGRVCRLDALEDFAESGYEPSCQRHMEG
jgi:hypothetical protein